MPCCAVCQWSEAKAQSIPRSDMCAHFRSRQHLQNWLNWCRYRQEQRISDDYVEDWLQQNQLLSQHRVAVRDVLGR